VWEEGGRYPNVIVELISESTADIDCGQKKDLYAKVFRTPDYFCYDPSTHQVEGWRLTGGCYKALRPNEHGRLWCEEFGLWLGPWKGMLGAGNDFWPRFLDPTSLLIRTGKESEHERAEAQTR
jgi:Uma2 family endonuclease